MQLARVSAAFHKVLNMYIDILRCLPSIHNCPDVYVCDILNTFGERRPLSTYRKTNTIALMSIDSTVMLTVNIEAQWRPLVGEASAFFTFIFDDLKPSSRPHDVCKQYLRIIANGVHENCQQARDRFMSDSEWKSYYTTLVSCLQYSELADFAMASIMNLCVGNIEAHVRTVYLGIDKRIAECIANESLLDEEGVGYHCAANYFNLTAVNALFEHDSEGATSSRLSNLGSLKDHLFATYSVLQETARTLHNQTRSYDSLRICLTYLQSDALQQELCRQQNVLINLINLYKVYITRLAEFLLLQEPDRTEALEEFNELDESYLEEDEEKTLIRQTVVDGLNRSGLPKDCRDYGQLLLTDAILERLVRISLTDEFVVETAAQKKTSSLLLVLQSCLENGEEGWVHDALVVVACSFLANAAENIDVCQHLVKETTTASSLLKVMERASDPTVIHATTGLARCLAKAVENRDVLGAAGFIQACLRYMDSKNENVRLQAASAIHLLVARCPPNVKRILEPAASEQPSTIDETAIQNSNGSPKTLFAAFLAAASTGPEIARKKLALELGKAIVATLRILHQPAAASSTGPTKVSTLLASFYAHDGLVSPIFALVRDDAENLRLEGLVGLVLVGRSRQGVEQLARAVNDNGEILDVLGKMASPALGTADSEGTGSQSEEKQSEGTEDVKPKTGLGPQESNALAALMGLTVKEVR
jgi:hypothetical protein